MEEDGGSPPSLSCADTQGGSVTKGREPASAPKVLFVYKDVLMKCIGSLLIWKLRGGGGAEPVFNWIIPEHHLG